MLPRFKYFLTLRELAQDSFLLLFSNMKRSGSVDSFESALANYFQRNYCITTSSYRMGVYYYLKSLNLPKGSEVLLTPITIPDLINVILLLDLKPIYIEMNKDNHSICTKSLKESLSDRSKVLILTYLSGIVDEDEEVFNLAKEYNLKVVEDISQSYGTKNPDGHDPYRGDVQIGSLSSGKLISTYTGGFVLTNESVIYSMISSYTEDCKAPPKRRFLFELISNFKILVATSKIVFPFVYLVFAFLWRYRPSILKGLAQSKMYTRSVKQDVFFDDIPIARDSIPTSWNTYLCDWQARVGLRFLSKLDAGIKKRQELGKVLIGNLSPEAFDRIPAFVTKPYFNFYHIPFALKNDRTEELYKLFRLGIDSEGYGLNLCCEESALGESCTSLENAHFIKYHSVFLPLHESFSKRSIKKMAHSISTL